MSQQPIQQLIRNNLTIPTLPEVVLRIRAIINDPDSGTAEVGALIAEDAPLAAKVLRIANSAYYGLSGECASTEHASTVLGMRVLRNIVTQAAVIQCFDHLEGSNDFKVQDLWRHASFTGHISAKIAERARTLGTLSPAELYACGLLHDVGKVVMLDGLGEKYLNLVKRSRRESIPLHKMEKEVLSFDHTDVGALVAKRWDLPDQVARTIQYHHGPRRMVATDPIVSIVANANILAHRIDEGVEPAEASAVFDDPTRDLLGLAEDQVQDIIAWAIENKDSADL